VRLGLYSAEELFLPVELRGDAPPRDVYLQASTMVVSMALFLGTCRSETRSVFGKSPFSNPFLLGGTLTALLEHLIAIHAGPTQLLLGVEPITVETWIRILLISPTILVVAEVHKHWRTE